MKMPDPMMPPITIMVASNSPIWRESFAVVQLGRELRRA